jgi:mannose-1-phosphate guanylyltransferase
VPHWPFESVNGEAADQAKQLLIASRATAKSMQEKIVPVILCGGEGRRLWPLSTPSHPKPFHHLGGTGTLFQQALARCDGGPFQASPIIVAGAAHRSWIEQQVGTHPVCLLLEQQSFDTCVAALAGALAAEQVYGECILAILAADHLIPNRDEFQATLARAAGALGQSLGQADVVLLGVTPRGPSPHMGYILGQGNITATQATAVAGFIEKPPVAQAEELLGRGALWNAGIFVLRSQQLLSLAARLAPHSLAVACEAFSSVNPKADIFILPPYPSDGIRHLSLDHAIISKLQNALALRLACDWSDLGTWDEVKRVAKSSGNYVLSEMLPVRVIGPQGLIIVATDQGILITQDGESTSLK